MSNTGEGANITSKARVKRSKQRKIQKVVMHTNNEKIALLLKISCQDYQDTSNFFGRLKII